MNAINEAPSWMNDLEDVMSFVSAHPEIKVTKTSLGIPKKCREEFYGLLDNARIDLVKSLVEDSEFTGEAIAHLRQVQADFLQETGATVVLPDHLESFCQNPFSGCSQASEATLLSYVQGRLSADEVLEEAQAYIPAMFKQLSRAAYETWMCYAFILQLNPHKAYLADTFDEKTITATATDTLVVGRQKYSPVLRLPEAVFECEDGLWAVKFELANELDFYGSKPLRRRDFSAGGDTRGTIGRRYLLLYKLTSLDSIPFVADRDHELVFPPTAMVGTFWPDDFESLYGRGTMQRLITIKAKAGGLFTALDGSINSAQEQVEAYGAKASLSDSPFTTDHFASFIATL